MDLRSLPTGLSAAKRIAERRTRVSQELGMDLSTLTPEEANIGHADEKNCEQMIGHVGLPVGIAGPLLVRFGDGKTATVYLPLATTEGALVASTNRGCKAITQSGGARIARSVLRGTTRSIAFVVRGSVPAAVRALKKAAAQWKVVGEGTSNHLRILGYDIEARQKHVFLTLRCDTGEAMGMNMVSIAAQAIATWAEEHIPQLQCATIAGNVDSDKKPSARTHKRGRGYEVVAEVVVPNAVVIDVLKTTPSAMANTAKAKLSIGSKVAGAISANLHAANIVAALYLATGQDAAHVVEGSLTDTVVRKTKQGLHVRVRMPAVLVGVRGGGTTLPAQQQCLRLVLQANTTLSAKHQLAETVAAAVLAGEISLLAAQASHTLAKAHTKLGR